MVAMNHEAVIFALSLLACGCAGAASVAPTGAPDASDEAGVIDAPDVLDVPAPPDAGDDRPAQDDRVLSIDPCDPVGVIDLGVVGLREGRTLRFDIPPARPPRRHDLHPPSGCGVDVPAHDLHVFRYTTMDAARLRVSVHRFGAAPPTDVFPPASLWLLDECRPDSPSSRCDGLVSSRSHESQLAFVTPGGIAAGTDLYFVTLLERGVWWIEVRARLPSADDTSPIDAGSAADASVMQSPTCDPLGVPGSQGARPRPAPPLCDPGLGVTEAAWNPRPSCARLLEVGELCGAPQDTCDAPQCRNGACTSLDGTARCHLVGEEYGPCALSGAPCRAGLQCVRRAPGAEGSGVCVEAIAPAGRCGRDHPSNPHAVCPEGYPCRASEPGALLRCLASPRAGERCDGEGSRRCAFDWPCVTTPRGDICGVGSHGGRCEIGSAGPFACPGEQICDPERGCFSSPRDGRESSRCRLTFPRCDDGLRCLEDRCVPPSPRDQTCQREQYLDRTTFRYPCAPGQGCGRVCRSTEFERALCCVDDGSSDGFCRPRPPLCDPGLKCVEGGAGDLRCVPDLDAGL
jgi:hypothetical protein